MDIKELIYYYNKFKYGEDIFHSLMQKRVREILLVSTFYDAFIFEQDGRLAEQIFGEFHELHLTFPSRITSVPTGEEALRKIDEIKFDLVITMMRIGEISPFELGRRIKQKYPKLPVLLLLNVQSDLVLIERSSKDLQSIDNVFLWSGDPRIFLAMIKYIEDLQNVEHDTTAGLVRVTLLVEDSIAFYSRLLPILFREIMLQTQLLISEELNEMQKIYRMRTRPKVLTAHTYEEAIAICEKYKEYLLCVLSDIRFPHQGKVDAEAGLKLINYLKSHSYALPILLQSSDDKLAQTARDLNVSFLNKHSDSLLNDLHEFIYTNLGFGDFVFRDANGREIDRAKSISEFERKLSAIPDESLVYHAKRNHISTWLIARGEIQVAREIRPLQLKDFDDSIEKERQHLINVFREVRSRKNRGSIIDFDPRNPAEEHEIVRLSKGSLGGKGRGIAFLNALLVTLEFEVRFKEVKIKIPKTAFIGTGEFDHFLNTNNLREKLGDLDDEHLKQAFLEASLSPELQERLSVYVDHLKNPLAVRSSGLLEDSQSQPFAGIYQTFMLPNNHPDKRVRQQHLENAIKMVYASTFLKDARTYIERIQYRTEEERMAVIIQEIVGNIYGDRYYPHLSGVAQSYNYYPTSYMKHSDGIASVALGLGQWVVDGEPSYRFCPQYPDVHILPPEDLLKNSQTAFYGLNMQNTDFDLTQGTTATLCRAKLKVAEDDGTLWDLASVWDPNDQRLRDGLSYYGPRVVTFANILRHKRFPLADILVEMLDIGAKTLGVPVEIEFAVNLNKNPSKNILPTFYLLQIRPFSLQAEEILLDPEEINKNELVLYTEQGMGNGVMSHIYDLVYLDLEMFDNTETLKMKQEVQTINEQMIAEDREYILIGPGRWGSRDRFLGVPVRWADINRAKVIVETGLEGFVVEASQGSHFFHNLVAMNAGYFTVSYGSERDFVDWEWLTSQKPLRTTDHFVHIRKETPFVVKMFGKKGVSVIYK
jgi:CheY-like chemotaxis protein